MLKVTAKITSKVEAQEQIGRAAAKVLNATLGGAFDSIADDMAEIIKNIILNSEFAKSFIGGELSGHLGVPQGEGQDRIEAIANKISQSLSIIQRSIQWQRGGRLTGGISIELDNDAFLDVIELPESKIITEKGEILEWLDWVLTEGDRVIIADYDVEFLIGKGRSGIAIMLPTDAVGWRVPSRFSGTIDDNWITREIKNNFGQLLGRMNEILLYRLKQAFR